MAGAGPLAMGARLLLLLLLLYLTTTTVTSIKN
jgi:hypothetical protein